MLLAIDATERPIQAAQAKRRTRYLCPGCHAPVILKRGSVTIAHFAHRPGSTCQTFSEGETAEHLRGKRQIAAWFERSGYQVRLEAPLAKLQQRPDILVQSADQAPLAIEFQCSPLSSQRLWERTVGYRQHGYRVLWLLGQPYDSGIRPHGKALKFLQHSTAWQYFILRWDVQTKGLTLDYRLLCLDCEPLSYLTLHFDTNQLTVDQVLRVQPQLQPVVRVAEHVQHYQHNVILGRLRQRGYQHQLQSFCYQHGGTLQQLPDWVVPMVARPPILAVPYLVWYLHLFTRLQAAPDDLAPHQLSFICWQTLQPLLARNPCVRRRGPLRGQLITAVTAELMTQGVIVATASGWHLNRELLQWKKR